MIVKSNVCATGTAGRLPCGCVGAPCSQGYDILEEGDMEEAINAANQIGDDTLQKQATGVVRPHSFTHESSAQRVKWFKKGMQRASLKTANT
jgi:uncharacterized protein